MSCHLRHPFVSSYPGGYAGLVAVALATHAVVGYTLGALLFDRPLVGAAGALAADVDLLLPDGLGWPLVHRGVTHTLLAGGISTAAVLSRGRRTASAFAVGYASQLLVDTTTPKGVPWLYPLTDTNVYVDLPTTGHSPVPTLALWACCLGLLWYYGELPRNPAAWLAAYSRRRRA
jgi:inner membrane protein